MSHRLVTSMMAGGYTAAFRGSGLEFDGVREYEEGDDPRLVDWNVTARVGRPFVKTYVDERELTVMFLLDLSASMDGGFSVWSARQTAARICACLALSAIRTGDKVGLIGFSDAVDKYVPPGKGVGHVLRIVRDCLALPGKSRATDLRPALEFASRVIPRHAVLFLVSDFLADGWQQALTLCARRHDVVVLQVLDPAERTFPFDRMTKFEGLEEYPDLLADPKSLREAYLEQLDLFRRRLRQGCLAERIDVVEMDTSTPLDVALTSYLAYRQRTQVRRGA